MAKTIILFWQNHGENYSWYVLNGEGELHGYHTTLADIIQTGQDDDYYRLIVIIPSVNCFFNEVKVPMGADKKIMTGIAYMIEEKIADEPETLFIARLAKHNAESWSIVAVKREWIKNIIQQLRDNNLEPDVMVPDLLLLPAQVDHITVALDDDYCWVQCAKENGLQLERDNLAMILEVFAQDPLVTKDTLLVTDKANEETLKAILIEKGFHPREIRQVNNWPLFWTQAALQNQYNLLQGELLPRRKLTKETKLYKIAALLFAIWLAVSFVGKIAQYIYFYKSYQITQNEIEKNYRAIFPEVTRIVSPKASLQREVEKLNEAKHRSNFLFLITDLAQVMIKYPKAKIENMDYKDSILTINLTADNFTDLKEIGQKLEQQGFSVKQENAVSQSNQVTARLILKRGATK